MDGGKPQVGLRAGLAAGTWTPPTSTGHMAAANSTHNLVAL